MLTGILHGLGVGDGREVGRGAEGLAVEGRVVVDVEVADCGVSGDVVEQERLWLRAKLTHTTWARKQPLALGTTKIWNFCVYE